MLRYRLRSLLPGQFGLFTLFALMTLAAIAFAIMRLPIHLGLKCLLLIVVWGTFRLWLQAARKQPATPANRINDAALNTVSNTIFPVFFAWNVLSSPRGHSVVGYLLIAFIALIPMFSIGRAIMVARSELRRPSHTSSSNS